MTTTTSGRTPSWVPQIRSVDWTCEPVSTTVRNFHRSLAGYAPTPLIDLPTLARELGVGQVLAKDESNRLGLPAFKALGASWAVHRVLQQAAEGQSLTIVAATDGNHGRAVARFARLLGHPSAIYIPAGVHAVAIQAIADEGAAVTVVDGSYDEAVAAGGPRRRGAGRRSRPRHRLAGLRGDPRLDRRRLRHPVLRGRRTTRRPRAGPA